MFINYNKLLTFNCSFEILELLSYRRLASEQYIHIHQMQKDKRPVNGNTGYPKNFHVVCVQTSRKINPLNLIGRSKISH